MLQREEKLILTGFKSSSWYLDSDRDVIAALEDTHKQMPISIKIEHVKGHQDNDKAFDNSGPITIAERQSVLDARRSDADKSRTHGATSSLYGIPAE
jgi:hypothetical protein